jgi:hypothetical protein
MYRSINKLITQLKSEKRLYNNYGFSREYPVCDFIHHLRNAVCHSGNKTLIFSPIEENRKIETVIFYDTYTNVSGKKNEFCVELTVEQVRSLIIEISKLYVAVENAEAKTMQEEYEATVTRYRELMNKDSKRR